METNYIDEVVIKIELINVAVDKEYHVAYLSHFWSQERFHFVARAHMYNCMYFDPIVYSLNLV